MQRLVLEQISRAFSGKTVLKNVSFQANRGQVIALLGSSGSGKSTLLRCINLLETPDTGTLKIDEDTLTFPLSPDALKQYPATLRNLRQKIGMVFQQFHLWPHLTVLDNLSMAPLKVLQSPPAAVHAAAVALLTQLGLADKAERYPNQLSGGQQQRVAIARALMMNPEFMLWDEPNSGLDPERSRGIADIIRQLSQQGITQIVATHDIAFTQDMADTVFFLEQGEILEKAAVKNQQILAQHPRFQSFLLAPPELSGASAPQDKSYV